MRYFLPTTIFCKQCFKFSEVKQQVEKRKQKRRGVAEKNKLLKKKGKAEETKMKENVDMWNRLVKLNGEFKEIKKAKKDGQNLFL